MSKTPVEWFGWKIPGTPETVIAAQPDRESQQCPFTESLCAKPRKSTPEVRTGICTVIITGGFFSGKRNIIICPKRFDIDVFFRFLTTRYFHDGESITWTPEVSMGDFGSIDYVANNSDYSSIVLFELQAAGTTGSPYPAIEEFISHGRFLQESYTFGINWANEFIKTMGQQIVKKGHGSEEWGIPLVFVLQDIAMEYIEANMNTRGITQRAVDEPWPNDEYIHFRTVRLTDGTESRYGIEEACFYTASLETAENMLQVESHLLLDDFRSGLISRQDRANIFTVDI